MDYDIFNGDADGICALIQLRLAEPRPDAVLVTGVKRDIQLLGRIPDEGVDRVTALDISFDKNREDVKRLLCAGAEVFFCDHHFSGDIPDAATLDVLIILELAMYANLSDAKLKQSIVLISTFSQKFEIFVKIDLSEKIVKL